MILNLSSLRACQLVYRTNHWISWAISYSYDMLCALSRRNWAWIWECRGPLSQVLPFSWSPLTATLSVLVLPEYARAHAGPKPVLPLRTVRPLRKRGRRKKPCMVVDHYPRLSQTGSTVPPSPKEPTHPIIIQPSAVDGRGRSRDRPRLPYHLSMRNLFCCQPRRASSCSSLQRKWVSRKMCSRWEIEDEIFQSKRAVAL